MCFFIHFSICLRLNLLSQSFWWHSFILISAVCVVIPPFYFIILHVVDYIIIPQVFVPFLARGLYIPTYCHVI